MTRTATALAIVLSITTHTFAQDDTVSLRELVESADRAIEAGDLTTALDAWEQARTLAPDEAALPFNMGIANYRMGNFDRAAELFGAAERLTDDAALRTRSTFNRGTTSYAQALEMLALASQPAAEGFEPPAAQDIDDALVDALRNYRSVLRDDPSNTEARANAELAQRLLRELRMQQQEQQQQQDQDQQDQDQQEQDQQNQQEQQGEGEQQEQGSPSEDEQGEEQQQPESSEEGQGEEESEGETSQDQQEQSGAQAESDDEQEDGEQRQEGAMTREEAERLLQGVRDRERARREALAEMERSRHRPARKDW